MAPVHTSSLGTSGRSPGVEAGSESSRSDLGRLDPEAPEARDVERWVRGQWGDFEFWEKVEARLRRRRIAWILGTLAVFLLLSSIPVVLQTLPRWRALGAARRLASVLSDQRVEASRARAPRRVRFVGGGGLDYVVEQPAACREAGGARIAAANLDPEGTLALVPPELARARGLPGAVEEICYDPLTGFAFAGGVSELSGFVFAPRADLEESSADPDRGDRIAILLVRGSSGELAFE